MNVETLLGERIAMARQAKGLSVDQLANQVGIKTKTLKNWELERSSPRANRLHQLASILDVPLLWLIAGSDHMPETVSAPNLSETARIEQRISEAETLLSHLGALLAEMRTITRSVQRDIDDDRPLSRTSVHPDQ